MGAVWIIVDVELSFEAFLDDFHVEEAEEAAAETEAEGVVAFGFEAEAAESFS